MTATHASAFIFMKVGDHAGETWTDILERKNREYKDAGRVFWGYGGTACHPLTQVQPFVRKHMVSSGGVVHLMMEPIHSQADPDVLPATEYSSDGVSWKRIPDGICVTGSRYALVLGEITPGDLDLTADDYVVGVGPSRGKRASQYIQGRIDKACLEFRPQVGVDRLADSKVHAVRFSAPLLDPYAVLLRNTPDLRSGG